MLPGAAGLVFCFLALPGEEEVLVFDGHVANPYDGCVVLDFDDENQAESGECRDIATTETRPQGWNTGLLTWGVVSLIVGATMAFIATPSQPRTGPGPGGR